MKKYLITVSMLTLTAVLLFAGCGEKKEKRAQDVIPVDLLELKKEITYREVMTSGRFTTDDETPLSFKTGGIVRGVFVKEGDYVKRGQVLASLELTEINSGVAQATIGYEKALRDYNRVSSLYKDSVATLSQYQNAKTALDIAAEQLNIARYNLNYSEIRASADGYILKKFVNEGQMAGPGTPVLLVNGAGKGNWVLRVGVSDREWAAIRTGDKAYIEPETASGNKLAAAVSRKSEGVDPASGTFTIDLRPVSLDGTDIATGLFGRAVIIPSETLNAWVVPYDAIIDGDRDSGFVFVTDDEKTVKKVKVRILEILKDRVLIGGGLEDAKALVISGSAYLTDGTPISLGKKKAAL